jgi:hypothetical protein
VSAELTIAEIKAMLADRVHDLARELAPRGKRRGVYWLGPSPLRADSTHDSFAIWLSGAAKGAWKDFVSGDKGDVIDLVACLACQAGCPPSREERGRALAWARDWLGVSGRSPAEARARAVEARANAARREAEEAAARAAKQRRAFDLWLSGVAMRDTAGEAYFRSRGVEARAIPHLEPSLRFKPRLEHPFEPHAGPAALAKFVAPDGGFAAVHCTFIAADGSGKADVGKAKIIFGSFAGAAIRVSRGVSGLTVAEAIAAGVSEPLAICEGVEDALTIAQARPEWRVWAAGSLDNIGNQPAPACVSDFLVVADNDAKPAARAALERGLYKLQRHNRPITIARALGNAKDFNDLLRGAA